MSHNLHLEASEARVLGVLIEKDLTTPDQYPLSLNALQTGCNQKSNRDPKIEMMEGEVFSSVERLRMMQLAGVVHPAGSRVERFAHNSRETLALGDPELAVLAELLMRGAQSKGDLRARANRMTPIPTQEELSTILDTLRTRKMVADLPPVPGSRAPRITELLSKLGQQSQQSAPPATAAQSTFAPTPSAASPPTLAVAPTSATAAFTPANNPIHSPTPISPNSPVSPAGVTERVNELTERVARLEQQLSSLAESLGENIEP